MVDDLVGVLGHVSTLGMEALVRIGGVVDNLELAVLVKEAVSALDVAVLVSFLVPELTVVTGERIEDE